MTPKRNFSAIMVPVCLAMMASVVSSQNKQSPNVKFPSGDWSLTHPVISQLGLADAPTQIINNTGDATKGLTITKVGLQNNSGKTISAVKFNWYLFRKETPKKILRKGDTPVILVEDFATGSERVVEYPVVSFANLYPALIKDGKLTGHFVIEIAVVEIRYADGSSWQRT